MAVRMRVDDYGAGGLMKQRQDWGQPMRLGSANRMIAAGTTREIGRCRRVKEGLIVSLRTQMRAQVE